MLFSISNSLLLGRREMKRGKILRETTEFSIWCNRFNTVHKWCSKISQFCSAETMLFLLHVLNVSQKLPQINIWWFLFHYRLCNLTLTRLVILRPLENDLTSVILAVKMQVRKLIFYFQTHHFRDHNILVSYWILSDFEIVCCDRLRESFSRKCLLELLAEWFFPFSV